jgi:hypothetical protein
MHACIGRKEVGREGGKEGRRKEGRKEPGAIAYACNPSYLRG